jgi:predicted transcriptional regulator
VLETSTDKVVAMFSATNGLTKEEINELKQILNENED